MLGGNGHVEVSMVDGFPFRLPEFQLTRQDRTKKGSKMSMMNWNEYLKQVLTGVGDIGRISPDIVGGYQALGGLRPRLGCLAQKPMSSSRSL